MIRSGEHAQWDAAMSEIMWAWHHRQPTSYEALSDWLRHFSESVGKASRVWAEALGPSLAKLGAAVQASGGSATSERTTFPSSGDKPGSS